MKKVLFTLATFLTIAVSSLAFSSQALAASSMCTTTGTHCVGAPNLRINTDISVVKKVHARSMVFKTVGKKFLNLPLGLLEFTGAKNRCLAASDEVNTKVEPCRGYDGVLWALQPAGNGSYRYVNRSLTQQTWNGKVKVDLGVACGKSGPCVFILATPSNGDGNFYRFNKP